MAVSMVKTFRCDRCGREERILDGELYPEASARFSASRFNPGTDIIAPTKAPAELCWACYDELWQWWQAPKILAASATDEGGRYPSTTEGT